MFEVQKTENELSHFTFCSQAGRPNKTQGLFDPMQPSTTKVAATIESDTP